MALQVIDLGLLDIAEIAQAQVCFPDGEIEGEELAHGRLVVQGGETDVLAEIPGDGHFIIRLSIFGREHQAHEREVQLVSQDERMILDAEVVNRHA